MGFYTLVNRRCQALNRREYSRDTADEFGQLPFAPKLRMNLDDVTKCGPPSALTSVGGGRRGGGGAEVDVDREHEGSPSGDGHASLQGGGHRSGGLGSRGRASNGSSAGGGSALSGATGGLARVESGGAGIRGTPPENRGNNLRGYRGPLPAGGCSILPIQACPSCWAALLRAGPLGSSVCRRRRGAATCPRRGFRFWRGPAIRYRGPPSLTPFGFDPVPGIGLFTEI